MFGKGKGAEPLPTDSTSKTEEYVSANISIVKKPQHREVSIIVVEAAAGGDTVYKASFRSTTRSDFSAYNIAKDMIDAFLAQEGLYLAQPPSTNAELPSITSHQKGARW